MADGSGQWLSILVCGGSILILTVIAAVLGTRSRFRFVEQIRINQKNGLYRNPVFRTQISWLILMQLLMFIAFMVAAGIALVTKSVLAMVVGAVAIVGMVIMGVRWHRLMTKG